MEVPIVLVSSRPERREELTRKLRELGFETAAADAGWPARRSAVILLDCTGLSAAAARAEVKQIRKGLSPRRAGEHALLSSPPPILALGTQRELPALEAAIEAGACEAALSEEELVPRLRLLAAASRRDERRSADELEHERQRLARAYAERFRELLESNRRQRILAHQKEELLGICAHDLRVPLQAILGHGRLLLEGERGELPRTAAESVDAIRGQAARMIELIEDLLDLHAIETGRLRLTPERVEFGGLVREVCDAMNLWAEDRGVAIRLRTEGEGPTLHGDASKLREAVANLVGNAIKFSPPGAVVEVAIERPASGGARLLVTDVGPGIPPDSLAALLSGEPPPGPASRLGSDRRGRPRGLGLAIAREIAALHGGGLFGHSEVGHGSTFVLELPASAAPATRAASLHVRQPPPPSEPQPAAEGRPQRRTRVLVVEDDDDVRELLVDLLAEDHEVFAAPDGEVALERAREERPDVILLDLFLPRLDGFGVLEELRRDARTLETPVLFLSADRDAATRVRGLELGAADFLAKPFSAAELKARISKVLRESRHQQQLLAIAQTDALTGLPNYRAFRTRLDEEAKRARRYRTPLAAVMIDLDNLKPINDELGHAAGNRAIRSLAEAVTGELRETDFAARYGGDEFVILLPHTSADEARALSERLRRSIRRREVEGRSLRASLGVAALEDGDEGGAEALIRAADAALYRAKRMGRDRVCIAGECESGEELVEGA